MDDSETEADSCLEELEDGGSYAVASGSSSGAYGSPHASFFGCGHGLNGVAGGCGGKGNVGGYGQKGGHGGAGNNGK